MKASEETEITEIKKVISYFLPESDVIMFGSWARGDYHISSDFDFLIITKETLDDRLRLHFQALTENLLPKSIFLLIS